MTIHEQGVTIDGELVASSPRLALDGQGKPWGIPEGAYEVEPAQFWVLSTYHPRSFDSRYFGPISQSAIIGAAMR